MYLSQLGWSADAYRYCAANSSNVGSSLKCPRPLLQWLHNIPRTFPETWSWSTTNGSCEPQITHSCVVALSSASVSSEITARNFPRLLELRYVARHALHQLSKPLRFLLCNGKNSAVAGLSDLQRVQLSSSMLSATTLYALGVLFRPSSVPASPTSLRKRTHGALCLFPSWGVARAASGSCLAFWQRLAPWRSSRRWGSCLPCVAMQVT